MDRTGGAYVAEGQLLQQVHDPRVGVGKGHRRDGEVAQVALDINGRVVGRGACHGQDAEDEGEENLGEKHGCSR